MYILLKNLVIDTKMFGLKHLQNADKNRYDLSLVIKNKIILKKVQKTKIEKFNKLHYVNNW